MGLAFVTCILFLLDSSDLDHDKSDRQLLGMQAISYFSSYFAHVGLGQGLIKFGLMMEGLKL